MNQHVALENLKRISVKTFPESQLLAALWLALVDQGPTPSPNRPQLIRHQRRLSSEYVRRLRSRRKARSNKPCCNQHAENIAKRA